LAKNGLRVVLRELVPDDRDLIAQRLRTWADQVALIITTGGTGFGPRDVTPEATLDVLERHAPGLTELMRAEGLKKTPMAALSRAVAGTRGRCLIVNLPGSLKAVYEGLEVLLPLLPHALETMQGPVEDHPQGAPRT
jgi:molybdenum cofactor synthesis domain-containing protein